MKAIEKFLGHTSYMLVKTEFKKEGLLHHFMDCRTGRRFLGMNGRYWNAN